MIISASRRTDIPAFYGEWFMQRIRAGFCEVANPYNPTQKSTISLKSEDVDCVVFWTRFPVSLVEHLDELTQRGFNFYFLYTLLDYPKILDKYAPSFQKRLEMAKAISRKRGKKTLVWRYDPIVLSNITDVSFHIDRFSAIAQKLRGFTEKVIVSILDLYGKLKKNIVELERQGVRIEGHEQIAGHLPQLLPALAASAQNNGMEIQSCAEKLDLVPCGILPGSCIDAAYIREQFGVSVVKKKDPGQRIKCGCAVSKDIGAYNTCRFGCVYCYATTDLQRAGENHEKHDPDSPVLLSDPKKP